ncbi:MAG TPA: hypothetical protein VFH95_10535 [Candidatus Kapabacteria bacterium]|nr:hypothetical protein [Candidatus Kapabacteria bacterium]
MKKIYIPVLVLSIAFANFGCEKKTERAKKRIDFLAATTKLMPPSVAQGPPPPPAAGDLDLTLNKDALATGNPVLVTVYFIGNEPQIVTVPAGATSLAITYTNQTPVDGQVQIPAGEFKSSWVDAPAAKSLTINISATLKSIAYPDAKSGPLTAGNNILGYDVTSFTDDSANQAVVVVEDGFVVQQ